MKIGIAKYNRVPWGFEKNTRRGLISQKFINYTWEKKHGSENDTELVLISNI